MAVVRQQIRRSANPIPASEVPAMKARGIAATPGRGGRARRVLPAPDRRLPADWEELLERLDRLERIRSEITTNGKGERG